MTEFVEKYYQMDPAEEDLLFDGTELRDGMIVLIEDDRYREGGTADRHEKLRGESLKQLNKYNRWAMVEHLRLVGNVVEFIGVFEDGRKAKFSHEAEVAWYVKNHSIPGEINVEAEIAATQDEENDPPAWLSAAESAWAKEKGTTTQL
jgi:hypothetical protein